MSEYAVGSKLFEDPDEPLDDAAAGSIDDYGACFINGLGTDSLLLILGMIVFAVIGPAVFLYLKRCCR